MENTHSKVFEHLNQQIYSLKVSASIPEVQQAIQKVHSLFYNMKIAFELELETSKEQGRNEILLKMLGQTYKKNNFTEEDIKLRKLLQTNVTELDIPVRAMNALRCGEVDTLGDLVCRKRGDVQRFRNFGYKSIKILDELLAKNNLKWNMNVDYLLLNEH